MAGISRGLRHREVRTSYYQVIMHASQSWSKPPTTVELYELGDVEKDKSKGRGGWVGSCKCPDASVCNPGVMAPV